MHSFNHYTSVHVKSMHNIDAEYLILEHFEKSVNRIILHRYSVNEGAQSLPLPVTSGVPQGTVLGPALFLCYINSMPEGISSSIRLFADDTVIYRQINSAADHTILQQDLHKLARWEAEYSMEFHPEKCNVLRVTRSRSPSIFNYTLHGTNLKSTESTKYLGVTLTKDLTWGKHRHH